MSQKVNKCAWVKFIFYFAIFHQPFRVLPWFSWVFVEGIKQNNIVFSSDERFVSMKWK